MAASPGEEARARVWAETAGAAAGLISGPGRV